MSKIAVITGGASGIGEATARRFAAAGWAVEIGNRDALRGQAVASELGGAFRQLDVASEVSVSAFAAEVLARRGAVDALVNSVGILQNAVRITEMTMEEFDQIHAINVRGSLLMNRAFGTAIAAGRSSTWRR